VKHCASAARLWPQQQRRRADYPSGSSIQQQQNFVLTVTKALFFIMQVILAEFYPSRKVREKIKTALSSGVFRP
jgi:hypothetical protein